MALLHEILDWTQSLPTWQRDAARRLLQTDKGLTDSDYTELYSLMKAELGFESAVEIAAIPLGPEHIPASPETGNTITLKEMRELKHVNRIPEDQILTFTQRGITIIYGGNSTGKSGYARVLKRACRARDQTERVLPDANDPAAKEAIPTATFTIEYTGVPKQIHWAHDQVPPEELSTVAVFDSRCARSYLTTEQDVAYLPYGLDIVENLANKVLPELSRRLAAEIAGIDVDVTAFEGLRGKSEVGKQIELLSAESDPEQIKVLGTLSEEQSKRLHELTEALAAEDPTTKANHFKLSSARLKAFGDRIMTVRACVDDTALETLREIHQNMSSAEEAEVKAAQALQAGETLLTGTGGQLWKTLFDAARRYSVEVAYPGEDFPNIGPSAVCSLCQQPLDESGRRRMQRFEQYAKDDIARTASLQRRRLANARTALERDDLRIGLDSALEEEIRLLDVTLPPVLASFESSLEERRTKILASLDSGDWSSVTVLSDDPRSAVRNLAARQLRASRMYARAVDPGQRGRLTLERDELAARRDLSKNLDAVLALLQRMKDKKALEKCYDQLRTRPISDKSKELASKAVSEELKSRLDYEFQALGVDHIRTRLKARSERGRMLHQLLLDLPTRVRIEDILSEGEQQSIAIGAFLAELSLAHHSGGIVLDDPVSSLDHWRRRNVARRLVQEATRRQVIVFTHDTTFLGQLRDEIDEGNVPHSIMFLECRGDCPGWVSTGLPWDHKGYKERIDSLEKAQKELARLWPTYPGEKEADALCHQYNRLRATLERVIQDVVFNGVIKRYRDWIAISRLNKVIGFAKSEYNAIIKLHKRCCDVIDAHDHPSDKAVSVLTPAEFGRDIDTLKGLVEEIRKRRTRKGNNVTR